MSRSRIQGEFEELQEILKLGPEPSVKESSREWDAWYLEERAFSQLQTIHDSKMQENREEIKGLKSEIDKKSKELKNLEAKLNDQLREMENIAPNLNEDFDEYIDELEDDILEREEEIDETEKTCVENKKNIDKLQAEISGVKAKNEEELSYIKNEKLRKLKHNKDHAIARKNTLQSNIESLEKKSQLSLKNIESFKERISSFKQRMENPNNIFSTARKAKLNTLIRLVNSRILRYSPEFMEIERGALHEVTALNDVIRENYLSNPTLIEAEVEESTQQMKDSLVNLTLLIDKSSCPRSIQRKLLNTLCKSRCVMESSKIVLPIIEAFVQSFQDFSLYGRQKNTLPSSVSNNDGCISYLPTVTSTNPDSTSKRWQQQHLQLNNDYKSISFILLKESDEGKKVLKLQDNLQSTIDEIRTLKLVEKNNHENVNLLQNQIHELKLFFRNKSSKNLAMIQKWQDHLITNVTKDAIDQAKKLRTMLNLNEDTKRRIIDLNKKKERGLKELSKRDEHGLIKIHLCH